MYITSHSIRIVLLSRYVNIYDTMAPMSDPDVWFRSAKRASGEEYYEYVLLYVDDVIVISEHAEKVIRDEIGQEWTLKEESIGPPSKYLGGMLRLVTLANGVQAWAFGSCQYV